MGLNEFLDNKLENIENNNLLPIVNKIIELENQLTEAKKIEQEISNLKENLKEAMKNNELYKWETPKGIKITLVEDKPDEEIEEEYYDEDKFMQENIELFQTYHNKLAEYKDTRKVLKKGKKGYVRITLPKE